ncbi:MAG: sugar kinase [Prevotella sp.]|nr:sugar kinase [Prevotella sp.]
MRTKFLTFGELLLRFSNQHQMRLMQDSLLVGKYGGSEANVAVSLATLGDDVQYITRLPDNRVGHAGALALSGFQVGVKHVLFGGNRIGTYYFEEAAGMRSAKVIYDRANSAYSELKPGMIPWREILKDVDVFHTSGITGAITQGAADATFEALDIATEMGKTISYDINYRKNLWQYGAKPKEVLSRMLSYADVVFADQIEYEYMTDNYSLPFEALDANYPIDKAAYERWFDDIHARWPRCKNWLLGTRNLVSSNHHTMTALLWHEGETLSTRIYDIPGIIDPVGVGDAFLAGFLHAVTQHPDDAQFCLDYSLAAATLKTSVPGDFNLVYDDEILELMSR